MKHFQVTTEQMGRVTCGN